MGLFKTKTKTMQTALEWFIEQLEERGHIIPDHIEVTSLIKEKQQIIDAYGDGLNAHRTDFCNRDEYFAKTYGSKGSETTSSQTTSDKWKEYQDWLNEVPQISDEEIEKASENAWSDYEYEEGNLYSTTFKGGWKLAIKWYREQLKQRQ